MRRETNQRAWRFWIWRDFFILYSFFSFPLVLLRFGAPRQAGGFCTMYTKELHVARPQLCRTIGFFFDHRSLLGARMTDITFATSVSASLIWKDHCQSPGNCSPGPISVNLQRPSPVHSRTLQGTANNSACTPAKKPRKKRALFNEGDMTQTQITLVL